LLGPFLATIEISPAPLPLKFFILVHKMKTSIFLALFYPQAQDFLI